MCMQCMAGAMTACAAASGVRAYAAARGPRWLTAGRLRVLTVLLLAAALMSSAGLLTGSSPGGGAPRDAPVHAR
jgi:hypothetical protein